MFSTLRYKDGDEVISLKPSCANAIRDELQNMFEVEWLEEVQREKTLLSWLDSGKVVSYLRVYFHFILRMFLIF